MPATEQTCYSMPRLHRIFAVSSVCLVLATLWMLVRDHRREWKEYQRTQERIELRLARWRKVQALSDEVLAERDRLQDALAEECARPLSPSVLKSLRAAMFADAERRGVKPSSWDQLQVAVEAVQAAAEQAESARRAWQAARLAADKANLQAEDAAVLVADYDLVLDGTDNFDTRYLLNAACVAAGKPLLSGAIAQWEGQLSLYDPARGAPCYACVFPQAPAAGLAPSCAEAGVVGALPGVIGAMMAAEAIKEITGAGASARGRLMIYDALWGESRQIAVRRRADCAVCGGTH